MLGFDWRNVSDHSTLPDGNYVGDVVNQHGDHWCGCCYVVSAVQMVEDRYRIDVSKKYRKSPVSTNINIQTILDHFEEKGLQNWSACHGGFPLNVLSCLSNRECPVVWERERGSLLGYSRGGMTACEASSPFAELVTIQNARRIPEKDVKRELLESGPVLLEVNGNTLKSYDSKGVVHDLTPAPPNHAVTVVGWKGNDWIVRNSWGRETVPYEIPSDLSCVGRGRNDCLVKWVRWSGIPDDPGYVLLPMRFEPLHSKTHVPWIVADVESVD